MKKFLRKHSNVITGYVLLLPALAVFSLMILYPFCNSIYLSFTDTNLLFGGGKFVFLDNYIKIFNNPNIWKLFRTTLTFVFFATLLPFTLGLIWAVVMNEKFKGSGVLRGLTLVNWIIPGISIAFLWSWIFNGDYGILNGILLKLGLINEAHVWLGNPNTAMIAVVVARSWQMFPWYMAFIMGGLQGVSNDQIEAARVDGASNIMVFFHVILPAIKPILTLILIMGAIGNFQHFDLINVMTAGGPEGSTATFATEVYLTAFKNFDIGKAAALGVIWAIVLSIFSTVYLRRVRESD